MSTNKTPNLNLHSWVETDPVLMSEFNENFNAIDANMSRIVTGSYVGDGTTSKILHFDFQPKLVMVKRRDDCWYLFYAFLDNSKTVYCYNSSGNTHTLTLNWGNDNTLMWTQNSSGPANCSAALNMTNWLVDYIVIGV